MAVYINGIGNISPQQTENNSHFLEEVVDHYGKSLSCVEPNYRNYINGRYLRRMSRVIKMGVSAAKICLAEVEVSDPDAIIVGTGLGCLEDTEKFLRAIYKSNEQSVSPTQFIQSTHNTVASQIAIMLGCNNYNFTYVHRGFSFESALQDALMQFSEDDEPKNILVGGLDESTESYLNITRRLSQWKSKEFSQLQLLANHLRGSLPGEGAAFFMLSNQISDNSYAQIQAVRMMYKPKDEAFIHSEINDFLQENKVNKKDVDLVLLGVNGDSRIDNIYKYVEENVFTNTPMGYFKHLCGEYKTATAFGLWLAAQILEKQQVPDVVKLRPFEAKNIKQILIYNNYSNINHTLLLIRHAQL